MLYIRNIWLPILWRCFSIFCCKKFLIFAFTFQFIFNSITFYTWHELRVEVHVFHKIIQLFKHYLLKKQLFCHWITLTHSISLINAGLLKMFLFMFCGCVFQRICPFYLKLSNCINLFRIVPFYPFNVLKWSFFFHSWSWSFISSFFSWLVRLEA